MYSGRPSDSLRLVLNASISLHNARTFSSSFGKSKGAETEDQDQQCCHNRICKTDCHELGTASYISYSSSFLAFKRDYESRVESVISGQIILSRVERPGTV